MSEIDNGPSHARRATKDGENSEPKEEEDENVSGPHSRVHEPLRIPVQIRWWHRLHIQIRHERPFSPKIRFLLRQVLLVQIKIIIITISDFLGLIIRFQIPRRERNRALCFGFC